MKKNRFKVISLIIMSLIPLFLASCQDDTIKPNLFDGLWVQESISEDGQGVTLSEKEQHLELLIEQNGIYRTHTYDASGTADYYGAWTTTDNKWIEFSMDNWTFNNDPLSLAPGDQWAKNHVLTRFTILSITDNKMEIRIKTYVGYKKYSPWFVAHERPEITEENYSQIDAEYKELKTYIFTFVKTK